jgi:hypothetical protein
MIAKKKTDALYIRLSFFTQQPASKMRSFFIFTITTPLLAWGGFRVGFDPVAYRCRSATAVALRSLLSPTVHVHIICINDTAIFSIQSSSWALPKPTNGRPLDSSIQSPHPPDLRGAPSPVGVKQTGLFEC